MQVDGPTEKKKKKKHTIGSLKVEAFASNRVCKTPHLLQLAVISCLQSFRFSMIVLLKKIKRHPAKHIRNKKHKV